MTADASRYDEAKNVLEKSEDAVERSRAVEALTDAPLPLRDDVLLMALEDPASIVVADALMWVVECAGRGLSEEAADQIRALCASDDSLSQYYAVWAAGRIGLPDVEPIFAELSAGASADDVALHVVIAEARFALTREARYADEVFSWLDAPGVYPDDLCFIGNSVLGLVIADPSLATRARDELLRRMPTVTTPFVVEAWSNVLEDIAYWSKP